MSKKPSIGSYFPKGIYPRPGQAAVLEAVEKHWKTTDVFVIVAPTGAGKTAISTTISEWAISYDCDTAAVLAPNNVLIDQFRKSRPDWPSLQAKTHYRCKDYKRSCSATYKKEEFYCKDCPYLTDKQQVMTAFYAAMTYHMKMALRESKDLLVIDEAHNLLPVIADLEAVNVWQRDVLWPTATKTVGDLRKWLSKQPGYPHALSSKLISLYNEIEAKGKPRYLIEKGWGYRWRKAERRLRLLPVDVSNARPHIWGGTKKLVLLSATIGPPDIEALGLSRRRVRYLEIDSPIPVENRPIERRYVGSLSYKNIGNTLPRLAEEIAQIASERPTKGLVHITYSMVEPLKKLMQDYPLTAERLVWHSKDDKRAKLKSWMKSDGKILMAAGMAEGLDLMEDLGRWQVVAKIAWPSLAEPTVKWKLEHEPGWYEWQAARMVVQASGRICRGPEDYGETFILDQSFERIPREILPRFFLEALKDD